MDGHVWILVSSHRDLYPWGVGRTQSWTHSSSTSKSLHRPFGNPVADSYDNFVSCCFQRLSLPSILQPLPGVPKFQAWLTDWILPQWWICISHAHAYANEIYSTFFHTSLWNLEKKIFFFASLQKRKMKGCVAPPPSQHTLGVYKEVCILGTQQITRSGLTHSDYALNFPSWWITFMTHIFKGIPPIWLSSRFESGIA